MTDKREIKYSRKINDLQSCETIGSDDNLVVSTCSWYFEKKNLKFRKINARWIAMDKREGSLKIKLYPKYSNKTFNGLLSSYW
jgi:hypothetical protein